MSQNERILAFLQSHANRWVPMTALGNAAGCWAVHSRIADLRAGRVDGVRHDIDNETRVDRGQRLSFYRLNVPVENLRQMDLFPASGP